MLIQFNETDEDHSWEQKTAYVYQGGEMIGDITYDPIYGSEPVYYTDYRPGRIGLTCRDMPHMQEELPHNLHKRRWRRIYRLVSKELNR